MDPNPTRAGGSAPDAGSPSSPTPVGRHAAPSAGGAARGLRAASLITGGALVLAFAYALVVIGLSGVLPAMWLGGGAVLAAATVAAVAVGLWRTRAADHPYRYTLLMGAAVLGLAVSLAAAHLVNSFQNFIDGIQPAPPGTTPYDVIVLVDHPDGVGSLAGQVVGQVAADPNKALVAEKLAELVAVDLVELDDPAVLADTLLNGAVDAVVIDRAYVSLIEDNRNDFAERTKILYTLDIAPLRPSAEPSPSALPTRPPSGSFLVYISGIDQYGPIGAKGRSDVNILMAVNPTTGHILLVTTPRDFYVQLHGTTGLKDKLTHAGVWGVETSKATLEDLYGLPIDYYLRINFSSVIQIVDLVGGVDVENDQAFTSYVNQDYFFPAGMNHLDGDQALAFARERYSFAAGDRARGQNQAKVIAALIHKIAQPNILLRYNAVLDAVQGAVETSVPPDQITALANQQLSQGTDWQIDTVSVNGSDASEPTFSYGSQRLYVMVPDMATVEAAAGRLHEVLER